ncbi:DALR domain-containing protein, partial [Limosilactobacillus fermentum]
GRPGWHIECSVMSTKYLGDTLDIHAGGQDLEFPHHENEIAQSEAKTGHRFVNYWMHNGFVTIGRDNEKMSKSLGNFVTVHDLIKEVDPQVLRFFMSTTQYRRPIQYSQESLVEAQANLEHLKNTYDNLAYRLKDATSGTDGGVQRQLADFRARFVAAMDDDINVQNGIAVVYELMRFANQYVEQRLVQREPIVAIQLMLKRLVAVFGVDLAVSATEINDEKIKELIEKRNAARAEKDFALSDQIRDQLRDQGIILEDTPQGTRYRKESN